MDDIKAKFAERFRILEEANPTQILPVCANAKQAPPVQPQTEEPRARDVPQFRCQAPIASSGKICSSSGGLKNLPRTHCCDRQSLTALHTHPREPNLFFNKSPVIKPQIYLKLAEQKTVFVKFTQKPLVQRQS